MMLHIKNGGIEQAFMELAEQEGVLSDNDKIRLKYLQSLPQNRTDGLLPQWVENGLVEGVASALINKHNQ